MILLVNFGGPRDLGEIPSFLRALLTDRDVIRSKMPGFLHDLLFSRVARKRAVQIEKDYRLIGGKSPIFEDTEAIAKEEETRLECPVLAFHRYLPATHASFLEEIRKWKGEEILVFPMFPQFSYATSGSIARWFDKKLPKDFRKRLRWVKSYGGHNSYIQAMISSIETCLKERGLHEEETLLFFSPHGLPQDFIETGDPYQRECRESYEKIRSAFPKAASLLAYQSKFGRGEWLRPYTDEICREILSHHEGRREVLFVPLSFTSDHIETLFEIEYQYLPLVRAKGLNAHRCPALNRAPEWLDAIPQILRDAELIPNQDLIFS